MGGRERESKQRFPLKLCVIDVDSAYQQDDQDDRQKDRQRNVAPLHLVGGVCRLGNSDIRVMMMRMVNSQVRMRQDTRE